MSTYIMELIGRFLLFVWEFSVGRREFLGFARNDTKEGIKFEI